MGLTTVLILFMAIIVLYLALIALFSLAFRITGLTRSKAIFQTISLLTAVGFTTQESETVTSSPARRRLAIGCMITGNLLSLLIVSLILDTIASFNLNELMESYDILLVAFVIFIGVLVIFNLPFVRRPLGEFLKKIGYKIYRKRNKGNVLSVIDNYGEDSVVDIVLNSVPGLMKDKTLAECDIKGRFEINILAIRRNGRSLTISGGSVLQDNDSIIVYGKMSSIKKLFEKNSDGKENVQTAPEKTGNSLRVLENYGENAMVSTLLHTLPDALNGKTLLDSKIKDEYKISVVMLKRNKQFVEINKDTVLAKGDTVIFFGPYRNIKFLLEGETEL